MKKAMRSILFLVSAFLLLSCAGCGEERTVCLTVSDTDFQISDARGKALTYDGEFSGEMELVSQSYLAGAVEGEAGEYRLEVPYSEAFTYQGEKGLPQSLDVFFPSDEGNREYAVSGTGLEEAVIALTGELTLTGEAMEFQVFLSLPCPGLGEHGCVRLWGTGADKVTFKVTETGIEFSGLTPEGAWLSYAGAVKNSYVALDLEVGSGTLDFSRVADGEILVTENGREGRTVSG